jgi:hypothetical protein
MPLVAPFESPKPRPLDPPPQVALYDTPGVTSAVRNREHGARVQGAWQVAQHCGVVLFMVDAARQVRLTPSAVPLGCVLSSALSGCQDRACLCSSAVARSLLYSTGGWCCFVVCATWQARFTTKCRPTCAGSTLPSSIVTMQQALQRYVLPAAPDDKAGTYGSAGQRGVIALSPPLTTGIPNDNTCACRSTSRTRV